MIFSDRKLVDRLPKKGDVHGSCKNPFSSCQRQSASGVISEDGAEAKPRLVFKIKLPPSQNKGEKPCKVSEDRADEKPVPTSSSGTNIVEEKPRPVFKIKLPSSLNKGKKSCKEKNDGKEERLVPTTTRSNGMRNGYCPTKSATRVATKKPFPTSSTAEKKACHLSSLPSSGGKKGRRVIKLIKSSAPRQNKEEELNTPEMAVQKTESTLAKTTEKSCLKNVQMDEKALELKLEASKRKLHQRYQEAQNAKRKIELIDFKDIPKPENAPKRSRNQYRRL